MSKATKAVKSSNGAASKKSDRFDLKVEIPELQICTIPVAIVGLSPLIMHRFSAKQQKVIEDKQRKAAKTSHRESRDPYAEYMESRYVMPGYKQDDESAPVGMPATAFKMATISSARFVESIPMTKVRGAIFFKDDDGGLIEIQGEQEMLTCPVRVGGKGKGTGSLDIRYRCYLREWSAVLQVEFNASVFSAEQVVGLINVAGFSVGVGDDRPERDGIYGRFHVKGV